MKRLLSLLAALPLLALPIVTAQSAHATTKTRQFSCTADAFQACSFANDLGWDVYNNTWNDPAMPPNSYTLFANSHSDWELLANQETCPTLDCAVEAYVSSQYNYDNTAGSQEIADIKNMSSYFSETMPTGNLTTNGFDAEAAYDIWLNNYGIEVMIWVDNQGQTPAGSVIGTARLAGRNYTIYKAGNTYSFILKQNMTHGEIDILPVLQWLTKNNYVDPSSYLTQFNFGFEICSTNSKTDRFAVNALTLQQSFR